MRSSIIVLLVSAAAVMAQMIGLPQAEVILAGTPTAPVVINNSSHWILAYTFVDQDAAGHVRPHTYDMIGQLRNNPRAGIAPGVSSSEAQSLVRPQIRDARGAPPPPPTQVFLDSVLFDNGVLVGPDRTNSFDAITARLQAQKDVNLAVEAGAWSKLQQIADGGSAGAPALAGSEIYQRNYRQRIVIAATEMLRVRERTGDAGALKLAASMAVYPTITRGQN
ncbi:MAG: hypothetical protein LAO55_18810 [Acidobacteriia bacterium]|nr:hypothetical protein [Terriglobia bacterium]